MSTTTHSPPTVVKWPFFAGDGLCIATMAAILVLADRPLSGGITAAVVVCLLVGVVLAIIPYLIEYEARLRVAEASAHGSIDVQIRKAAAFAEQLNHSVSRSQATAEQIEKVLASNEESMEKLAEQVETIEQWAGGNDSLGRRDDSKLADSLKSVEAGIHKLTRATADLAGREHITPDLLRTALAELNLRPQADNIDPARPEPSTRAEIIESPVEPKGAKRGSHLDQSELPEAEPHFTFNEKSTSLIATAYIGIGNKLFLRGDGPGLSWEEGVPMQFLSIGKWGWSTLGVEAPVTCRIYKNDDEPAIDGDILLNPAELKEISPRF
jgi:hypothetical protein